MPTIATTSATEGDVPKIGSSTANPRNPIVGEPLGAGVFLEHAEHEVNRHEAGHDAYCRNQSELDILNKVLAGCLHNRYKQSGRKGIVKHYLVEFLGIVAGEYTLLSGKISGEHHHYDRDDGI